MIRDGWTANNVITRALLSDAPDLGFSDEEATRAMELIANSGREDVDALSAYDVLWERVTYGKAI